MVLYFSLTSAQTYLSTQTYLSSQISSSELSSSHEPAVRARERATKPARDPAAHSNINSERADCHTAARRDLDWTRREGCDRNHVRQRPVAAHRCVTGDVDV